MHKQSQVNVQIKMVEFYLETKTFFNNLQLKNSTGNSYLPRHQNFKIITTLSLIENNIIPYQHL